MKLHNETDNIMLASKSAFTHDFKKRFSKYCLDIFRQQQQSEMVLPRELEILSIFL